MTRSGLGKQESLVCFLAVEPGIERALCLAKLVFQLMMLTNTSHPGNAYQVLASHVIPQSTLIRVQNERRPTGLNF